ncbi:MAG: hypothetical protein FWC70_07605 [Defluviitaleaceae bacterium]|nr:hypothetical protein [Defluviitaleaceae bacterium]
MTDRNVSTTERLERVSIEKLIPYARNARTHSDEQILQLRATQTRIPPDGTRPKIL